MKDLLAKCLENRDIAQFFVKWQLEQKFYAKFPEEPSNAFFFTEQK